MKHRNLNLRHEDLPYRPCVGVMLLNRDGLVFVGKRIDQTVEGWQMPQGGIDDGETPAQAALARTEGRDRHEQGATSCASIPNGWPTICPRICWAWRCTGAIAARSRNGSPCGLRAMTATSISPPASRNSQHWKWLAIEALPRLIVPFKRDTYAKVIADFRDLAGPEA